MTSLLHSLVANKIQVRLCVSTLLAEQNDARDARPPLQFFFLNLMQF